VPSLSKLSQLPSLSSEQVSPSSHVQVLAGEVIVGRRRPRAVHLALLGLYEAVEVVVDVFLAPVFAEALHVLVVAPREVGCFIVCVFQDGEIAGAGFLILPDGGPAERVVVVEVVGGFREPLDDAVCAGAEGFRFCVEALVGVSYQVCAAVVILGERHAMEAVVCVVDLPAAGIPERISCA